MTYAPFTSTRAIPRCRGFPAGREAGAVFETPVRLDATAMLKPTTAHVNAVLRRSLYCNPDLGDGRPELVDVIVPRIAARHPDAAAAPLPSVQGVHFYQCNAGGVIHAAHNRGVFAGCESAHDSRFGVVRRRNGGRLNLALLRCFPVVVTGNDSATGVVQLQHRISQGTLHPGTRQAWTDRTHQHLRRARARSTTHYHSADQHIFACIDKATGADVSQL